MLLSLANDVDTLKSPGNDIFLMMIILMNDVKSSAPDTNSINAIDMYLAVCTLCVFLAMIEYAIILMIMKLYDFKGIDMPQNIKMGCSTSNKPSSLMKIKPIFTEDTPSVKYEGPTKKPVSVKNALVFMFYNLDWISLLLIPIIFIIFNICYWSQYY